MRLKNESGRQEGMKILLVTGQLAKELVLKQATSCKVETKVVALDVAVAALMSPGYIARELSKSDLEGVKTILIPGTVKGDAGFVEKQVGLPTYKGPKHASDIPTVLDYLGKIQLSKVVPADELLKEELRKKAFQIVDSTEKNRTTLLKRHCNTLIGDLPIGKDFPPRVMAEIVDAPLLADEEIRRKTLYYAISGADIIDIGMLAGEPHPHDASRAVKIARRACACPVSIDTMDPDEAREGVAAGAQAVLSLDGGNLEEMSKFVKGPIAGVVIPTNFRAKYFPKEPSERLSALEQNVKRARELGVTKLLADPILDLLVSPGLTESLVAYYEFRRRNPDAQLFMGVGNITELTDTDTTGMSALLTGMATELGVSVMLTTEVSDRAVGNVKEFATATKMMFVAKTRGETPKGIGIDLIFLRDKKLKDTPLNIPEKFEVHNVEVKKASKYTADLKGYFRISVDRQTQDILVMYFAKYDITEPNQVFKGKRAIDLYMEIADIKLVSRLDHAAYLGAELQKAELALKLGKSYIQDASLY